MHSSVGFQPKIAKEGRMRAQVDCTEQVAPFANQNSLNYFTRLMGSTHSAPSTQNTIAAMNSAV